MIALGGDIVQYDQHRAENWATEHQLQLSRASMAINFMLSSVRRAALLGRRGVRNVISWPFARIVRHGLSRYSGLKPRAETKPTAPGPGPCSGPAITKKVMDLSFNPAKTPMYFVIGCARSGTTSLCRILDTAANGVCQMEPIPNLNFEARELMEGRYERPYQLIVETIFARAAPVMEKGLIYGEKNITLGTFIPYLGHMARCKFVYVKRDGRDVVRSLINWHNQMFGSIYRECKEEGTLTPRAKKAGSDLPIEKDLSDYSRPRPGPDDIWYERWADFTRLEMCAWYWSRINDQTLDRLEAIPPEDWIGVDYSSPVYEQIVQAAAFLGLEGLSAQAIDETLETRINSLEDRIGETGQYPCWQDWPPEDRIRFECIAARTMQRLGYYPEKDFVRYCPPNYGDWWRSKEGGAEWYEWMYQSRLSAHSDLKEFIGQLDQSEGRLESVLDVGCGLSVGYAEEFADRRYVGIDLSEKEIGWCRQNRKNANHEYKCGDIIKDQPGEKFDLVFSQGTIDNNYDMDAFLRALIARSKRWIYLTAYRGWFPDLKEHRYSWDEATTCFYNDISPGEVQRSLERLGCRDISVEPLKMENSATQFETRIVARVPESVAS